MLLPLFIMMFQEFVKTLKEAGVDKIASLQDVESCSAPVKHKAFNALDRFKPKEKKKEKV
jgi:hypothetical protein